MTAAVIIVQQDAVHIATDTAGFDENYAVSTFGSKQLHFSGIKAAATVRGSWLVAADFQKSIGSAADCPSSYDELKLGMRERLERLISSNLTRWNLAVPPMAGGAHPGAEFNLIIAGWSETTGPNAYYYAHALAPDGSWKLTFGESGASVLAPSNDKIVSLFGPALTALSKRKTADGDTDMFIQLMNAQRIEFELGGSIELTTIKANDVNRRIIARWPDAIGSKVDNSRLAAALSCPEVLKFPFVPSSFLPLRYTGSAKFAARPFAVGDRLIAAGSITAINGAIDHLAVQSFNIQDNAVTVPSVAVAGATLGNSNYQNAVTLGFNVDTTGLAGKTISVIVTFSAQQGTSGGNSWGAALSSAGSVFAGPFGGTTFQPSFSVSGLFQFTASGGNQFVSLEGQWLGPSMVLQSAILTATAAKR